MKKIYVMSLAVLSLAVGLSSCDLDTPSKSAADAQTVFTTPAMAESAVMGICISFCETNSYRGRFLPYYGLNTDCEWINGCNTFTDDKHQLCQYNAQPNSQQMNTNDNAYAKFYEGIERANQAIDGLRRFSDQGDPFYRQLLGEAITLRAVIYCDLIKGWGDVPARFQPVTSETLYLYRSDRDIIYKQLLADLLEAEDLCAWPNETAVTTSTERVSKAFVKALRARIALYASGYSYRADGTVRRSKDPALECTRMYTIAAQECEEVIARGCNRLGEFADNFRRLCADNTEAGYESIYELPFSEGRGRVLYTFGIRHASADRYTAQAKGGQNGPLPNLFYDYSPNDARRDITCVPYSWIAVTDSTKAVQGFDNTSAKKWMFGKLRYEWMKRRVVSDSDDGINWQFMRLADVYLMAAEAENQLGNITTAWNYLLPVLTRVLPAEEIALLRDRYTDSMDEFQLGIEDQRKFEFAGEMLRKADLIRWNKLSTNLYDAKNRMDALFARQGAYSDLPDRLYYTYEDDGETLRIYGLNHGENDAVGEALMSSDNYMSVNWLAATSAAEYNDYLFNPNIMPLEAGSYWPIWDVFVNDSNNKLTNYATTPGAQIITEY